MLPIDKIRVKTLERESRCLHLQLRVREPASLTIVSTCAGDNNTHCAAYKYVNMATSHQENTALLTEHFRYTPLVRNALSAMDEQC